LLKEITLDMDLDDTRPLTMIELVNVDKSVGKFQAQAD